MECRQGMIIFSYNNNNKIGHIPCTWWLFLFRSTKLSPCRRTHTALLGFGSEINRSDSMSLGVVVVLTRLFPDHSSSSSFLLHPKIETAPTVLGPR
mmetsp:Transcript_32677/g.55111  ORF Transcript_32677/g.55111 Transcript_32677/m.55111 type:complete len:96 (+) Transcript_32677:283-570(+)